MRAEIPPLADRLRLILWCSAPGLAAAFGSFRAWPVRWVCISIVVAVAVVAIARTKPGKPTGKPPVKGPLRETLGFLLFFASFVFAFVALNVARPSVLGLVGRTEVAYIGARDVETIPSRSRREKVEYCYHLLRADGSAMTGRTCRDEHAYTEGQAVVVMTEPTGLIAPETQAEVAASAWIGKIGAGAFALICAAALLGGGPAAPERPLVPPSRYPVWRPGPPRLERRHRPQRRPRRSRRR